MLNDQFMGTDSFEQYLAKIETATPAIRALGVTDYYLLDTYERVRDAKLRDGRLAGVDLVFPNVELRLAFGTVKGNWVNCHLLINPEDPDHGREVHAGDRGPAWREDREPTDATGWRGCAAHRARQEAPPRSTSGGGR